MDIVFSSNAEITKRQHAATFGLRQVLGIYISIGIALPLFLPDGNAFLETSIQDRLAHIIDQSDQRMQIVNGQQCC